MFTDNRNLTVADAAASSSGAILPFRISVPESALADLRGRVHATRWPGRETVADESQGVRLEKLRDLLRYWEFTYDWRRAEGRLNALPQFITQIDGLDIQFVHIRSRHSNALPLLMTHGWPGSIFELLKVAGPLTDPTAYGGRSEDAFDLVLPSIPEYGFSGKPLAPDWPATRMAKARATLMSRLGYDRYLAQGGDWGAVISHIMALQKPPGLLGIHTNIPATVPPDVAAAIARGRPAPAGRTPGIRLVARFFAHETAYAAILGTRPQTLNYALADSPAAQAAWIYEKFVSLTDSGGVPERVLSG